MATPRGGTGGRTWSDRGREAGVAVDAYRAQWRWNSARRRIAFECVAAAEYDGGCFGPAARGAATAAMAAQRVRDAAAGAALVRCGRPLPESLLACVVCGDKARAEAQCRCANGALLTARERLRCEGTLWGGEGASLAYGVRPYEHPRQGGRGGGGGSGQYRYGSPPGAAPASSAPSSPLVTLNAVTSEFSTPPSSSDPSSSLSLVSHSSLEAAVALSGMSSSLSGGGGS